MEDNDEQDEAKQVKVPLTEEEKVAKREKIKEQFLRARQRQRDVKLQLLLKYGAGLIGVGFALLAITVSGKLGWNYSAATPDRAVNRDEYDRSRSLQVQIAKLAKDLEEIDSTQQEQFEALKNISPGSRNEAGLSARIATIEGQLKSLHEQNEELSKLLGNDPVKTMSVVLMSKDLSDLKVNEAKDVAEFQDRYKADIAEVREESKGQLDFMKWGLLFVGASNLFGPIVGFFRPDKKDAKDPEPAES